MVKTTHFARPERVVPSPREGLAVVHAKKPTVAYYRFLYDAVGRDYDWTSRKKLSDAELAAMLHDDRLSGHGTRYCPLAGVASELCETFPAKKKMIDAYPWQP